MDNVCRQALDSLVKKKNTSRQTGNYPWLQEVKITEHPMSTCGLMPQT